MCTRVQASPEREGATIVELDPLWSPAGLGPVLFFLPSSVNQEQVWPCQKVLGPRHGMSALLADVALKELLEAGTCFLVLCLTVRVLNSIIDFDSAAPLKVHSRSSPSVCPHFSCFCSAVKSPLKLSSPSDPPSLQETWDLSGNRLLSSAPLALHHVFE